jgi:terminase small subunit-like protein
MTETRYTPELAADILRCVSEGTPLRQVRREKGLPEATARGWFRDDRDGLAAKYEAARRMQVDAWADEIVLLANRDDLDAHDKRVRIDTLEWLCSKLVPRRYGDRLLVAGDAESPLQ